MKQNKSQKIFYFFSIAFSLLLSLSRLESKELFITSKPQITKASRALIMLDIKALKKIRSFEKNALHLFISSLCQLEKSNPGAVSRLKDDFQELLKHILRRGGDLEFKDFEGNTALSKACLHHLQQIAPFLISLGANIETRNKQGYRPIHQTCISGAKTILRSLLEKSVLWDTLSKDGKSPLVLASEYGHKDIITILQKLQSLSETEVKSLIFDLDLDRLEKVQHFSVDDVYDFVTAFCWKNKFETVSDTLLDGVCKIIARMLERGSSVDITLLSGGSTALHLACANGFEKLARFLLLECGANVNEMNCQGITCLDIACFHAHESIAQFLIENGADIDTQDRWLRRPIHYCCMSGCELVLKILIKKGVNLTAQTLRKETPLSLAMHYKHDGIIKILKNAFKKKQA